MSSPILDHPGLPQVERLLAGGTPPPMAADLLVSLGVSDLGKDGFPDIGLGETVRRLPRRVSESTDGAAWMSAMA